MLFFFFNDTATTEIYTLSLHDALPICGEQRDGEVGGQPVVRQPERGQRRYREAAHRPEAEGDPRRLPGISPRDRKSTRLNSSHGYISYAVFCLKKKKKKKQLEYTA